tara:strand:- start:2784 stop:3482 length:699 start_codon:yes stop_codon:yes gene_type:complete
MEVELPIVLPNKPSCNNCDLHEAANSVCVPTVFHSGSLPGYVNTDNLIFFIGQNPGFHEDVKNRPFVGRSGDLVKQAYIGGCRLQQKATIYLGNSVRCHTPSNEKPKMRHSRECSTHMMNELQLMRKWKPKKWIIVTLGAPATTAFYKYHAMELIPRGKKTVGLNDAFALNGGYHEGWGFHLFSTYHPAAVLRNNNYINAVESHMQLVSDCLDDVIAKPSDPIITPTRSPRR